MHRIAASVATLCLAVSPSLAQQIERRLAVPVQRPSPLTGTTQISGKISAMLLPGEEADPLSITFDVAFDDLPGALSNLLTPETGSVSVADGVEYCGLRNVTVSSTAEGGAIAGEMCVDAELLFLSYSGFQKAFVTFAIDTLTDGVQLRWTSINLDGIPGEIDQSILRSMKPIALDFPPELTAMQPMVSSAKIVDHDGQSALRAEVSFDPAAATNGDWRRIAAFLIDRL